jgi:sporulation protein YlmC with PRC-barrel domain
MDVEVKKVFRASKLAGVRVTSPEQERVGEIEDVVIDLESGRVAYAVLCSKGFMGFHEKLFAVPWHELSLQHDDAGRHFVLNTTRQKLKSAKGFDKDDWPDVASANWQSAMAKHFGKP